MSINTAKEETVEKTIVTTHEVYQCKNCLSIYDDTYGDELNGIAPGMLFESLTEYCCPTCDSPKEDFMLVNLAKATLVNQQLLVKKSM